MAKEKLTAAELAYEILIENDGNNFIYTPLVNYADHTFGVCKEMLDDKNAIMGLGDGGAHVGFILDTGYQHGLYHIGQSSKKHFQWKKLLEG